MKRGEETLIPNWALDAEEALTLLADARVFKRLVRFRNYRDNTYSTLQLAYTLEIDQRTVRASLERLRERGLILSHDGRHCSPEAASKLPPNQIKTNANAAQAACKDAAKGQQKDPALKPKNSELDELNSSLNKGTKGTDELKDKNTPLTPQGVSHPEDQEPELPENQGGTADPVQVDQGSQDARPGQATDKEDVPRRRAAPPALPDDLAALPGVPEAWAAWVKYAREVRLKLTESVADAQFSKLRKLHAEGWELPSIVQYAIENSWKSFFPIRGEGGRQNLKLSPPTDDPPRRSYQ